MQDPGGFVNPGFHTANAAEKQNPSNPPPPYYPPMPTAPGAFYPPYYPTTTPVPQPVISQQSTSVVVVNASQTSRVRQKDYLCWSILNFLFCCWILGIIAIVFSCKTRSDDDRNDVSAAASSSKITLCLNIASLLIGIILYIVVLVYYSNL